MIAACAVGASSAAAGQTATPTAPATAMVPLPPPADLTRPQPMIGRKLPVPEVRPAPETTVPAGTETVMVSVSAITVEGNTVYDPSELANDYAGLIGHQVALAEIFRAAARIETRYRRDGYVLARAIVPEQAAAGGLFRIRIVEGYIDAVQVTGDGAGDAAIIRRYLDPVVAAKPARLADIERALLLINRLPGVAAHAVLTPEAGVPGAARLVVDARRDPLSGFATINNRGSHFAGPVTGSAGIDLNLAGGAHVGGLFFTTFNNQQNYGEVSADTRVGGSGLRVRGWLSDAISNPGSILAPLAIHSRSLVGGAGADYPLVLRRMLTVAIRGSFEVTADRTAILAAPSSDDRQRIVRLGIDLTHRDVSGVTSLSFTLHKGLDIVDASHDGGAVPQSRLGGRSDFFKLTGTASRAQALTSGDWGGLAVQVSLAGQYAADRLLALEQFHAGGEQFGRGFNPSQLSGDDGLAQSVELQLTPARTGPFSAAQLYGFFDAAQVHDRGVAGWTALQSAGGGLRFDLGPHLSGQIEAAVPYLHGRQNGNRLDRSAQGFFRLTARF